MQIILLLTVLTLLPAIFMSVTPFLRIVVVLHFLRQALGTQTAPSNQVLVGLALFLSLLVMQPVADAGLSRSLAAAGRRNHHAPRRPGTTPRSRSTVSAALRPGKRHPAVSRAIRIRPRPPNPPTFL